MKPPLCPRCRSLGKTTDCADVLRHASEALMRDDDSEYTELSVTVTFAVLVTVDEQPLREKALELHDRWVEDPAAMVDYLAKDVVDDFELRVHTPAEL